MATERTRHSVNDRARQRDIALCLALLASLGAALPLVLGPGMVNTRAGGDSLFLVQRVHQLAQNLRAGILPARWMPEAAYGLGYPAFNYYAALPYYMASSLHLAGLSIPVSIQITQVLGFLLAGGAMYWLARDMGARGPGAMLASVVYSFAPFHMVNVYVRGDSLSEFYAFAFYAIILLAIRWLVRRPSPERGALVAITYAMLVTTHNISAMVFSPVAGAWLLAQLWGMDLRKARPALLYGGLALALGLTMSLWFWGPALEEQPLVQLQAQTTGYLHYEGHFRSNDLVEWGPLHDYSIAQGHDPFAMGGVQAVIAILAVLAWAMGVFKTRGAASRSSLAASRLLLLLTLAGYTWLITPSSKWVWDHVPLLPYSQFPWRLLSVQALAIALLAPTILEPLRGRAATGVVLALSLAAIVGGLGSLVIEGTDRIQLFAEDITPRRLMLYETYSGNMGSTIRHEYLPREMVPRPYTSAVLLSPSQQPEPLALEGHIVSAQRVELVRHVQHWRVEVSEASLVAFHTTAFAGWRATVDGQERDIVPTGGLGLLGLRLEPGEHDVHLRFRSTRVRTVATLGSAVGLAIWLILVVWPCLRSRRYRRAIAIAWGVVALGAVWLIVAPSPEISEGEASGPLVMDFARAPYPHHEVEGVLWGDAILEGYRYSSGEAIPEESLTITTEWHKPMPGMTLEIELLGASAHLFSPRPTWAKGDAPVDARIVPVTIEVPPDMPPGLYVPRVKVYVDGEQVKPQTARGYGMDKLTLAPLQISTHRPATGTREALGSYGPADALPVIDLVDATIASSGGRYVELRLTWRSERQAPLNYMMSVRLTAPDGSSLASRDIPPLLGGYPTSLWKPGELVSDHIPLKLDDDVPPDAIYDLTVILYDRATLGAVGTTILRGVRPTIE